MPPRLMQIRMAQLRKRYTCRTFMITGNFGMRKVLPGCIASDRVNVFVRMDGKFAVPAGWGRATRPGYLLAAKRKRKKCR